MDGRGPRASERDGPAGNPLWVSEDTGTELTARGPASRRRNGGQEPKLKRRNKPMRNLKRALSLALAAAMLISLMVVGASAASYGDQDQVSQTEAVDVLTGLGIVGG